MMKKLKWILFLLVITNSVAQSTKSSFARVEYDVFYNTEIPNTKKGVLEIDVKENNAVFFLTASSLASGASKNGDVMTIIGKNEERYMKTNSDKKVIQYTEFIKNETYLVNDTVPELKWKISFDETKKIADIVCNKATLSFRGRNFIAWYDMNTPLNFGPWKFNNLPGLILEIYDETKRYSWVATAVFFSNNPTVSLPIDAAVKQISYKNYIDLKYNQINSTLSSQMPRGVETQTINVGRTGIETQFEWEKE
jgi:GLPGLI family protein